MNPSLHLLISFLMISCACSFGVNRAFVRSIRRQPGDIIKAFGGSPRRRRWSTSSDESTATLEWESFEFGDSPKWDRRFDSGMIVASNDQELDRLVHQETEEDAEFVRRIDQTHQAWQLLSPSLVDKSIETLRPYVNDNRIERIESVLQQRTQHTRFLFENPANPSNVWACLRSLDSFGIQHVDVVIQSGKYKGKAALSQKRGMRTAMGSAQWLTLRNHPSTQDALSQRQDCRVYAADVNPSAKDIRDIDWQSHSDKPVCIVMGNEETGISDEMRELADETFYLPMSGFAESFNLSVATAITLAYLSAASTGGKGPLRPGDLSEREYKCLLLKGFLNSLPKRKMAMALLRKEGIELPQEINLL